MRLFPKLCSWFISHIFTHPCLITGTHPPTLRLLFFAWIHSSIAGCVSGQFILFSEFSPQTRFFLLLPQTASHQTLLSRQNLGFPFISPENPLSIVWLGSNQGAPLTGLFCNFKTLKKIFFAKRYKKAWLSSEQLLQSFYCAGSNPRTAQ